MGTKLAPEYYLPLWEQAEAEEIGIEVKVDPDDQHELVKALYECRKSVGRFADLMVFQPPPLGTLFIAHKNSEAVE
jgi:hypothetical protein